MPSRCSGITPLETAVAGGHATVVGMLNAHCAAALRGVAAAAAADPHHAKRGGVTGMWARGEMSPGSSPGGTCSAGTTVGAGVGVGTG